MFQEYAIICVDDEAVVLEGLAAQLGRQFGRSYLIEMAQSAEEALELFEDFLENDVVVPVLITDQIMPGMKGSELLKKVREISEPTLSIMLTGQAGAEEVGDALNRGNLYRYMSKPWESTDLILTVQEALRSFNQKEEIRKKNQKLAEYAEQLEEKVRIRTKELQEEKEKSEQLLLNILPEETADELKKTGESPPRAYAQVSVLFTDFVRFSNMASNMKPQDLVASLGECFNAFDEIIDRYQLEKIKTIGDAYMCAGGIPNANTTNAHDAVRAAVAMRDWLKSWNQDRINQGLEPWKMRIGIHTGELVAGVIGTKKFAYDVWGDAVNVANRMEVHGEPEKINISNSTYELVRNDFHCTYRGSIHVKGKGPMEMYFVE